MYSALNSWYIYVAAQRIAESLALAFTEDQRVNLFLLECSAYGWRLVVRSNGSTIILGTCE